MGGSRTKRLFEAAIGRGSELACTLISQSLTTQRFLNLSRRKTTSWVAIFDLEATSFTPANSIGHR